MKLILWLSIALVLAGTALFFAFTTVDVQVTRAQAATAAEEATALATCTRAGGIIIRSGWTHAIVDCKVVR